MLGRGKLIRSPASLCLLLFRLLFQDANRAINFNSQGVLIVVHPYKKKKREGKKNNKQMTLSTIFVKYQVLLYYSACINKCNFKL